MSTCHGCSGTAKKISIYTLDEKGERPHINLLEEETVTERAPTLSSIVSDAILMKNDRWGQKNRGSFAAHDVLVLQIVSAAGAGKTTLIERTINDLKNQVAAGIIVGSIESDKDARRLSKCGVPTLQITTGHVCHLEAEMVAKAVAKMNLSSLQLLIIENLGNLVCPVVYNLGEDLRVAVLSVTDGEDQPLKYPTVFKAADVVIINKIDLAETLGFNREVAISNLKEMAPQATILEVSAKTGENMKLWYRSLAGALKKGERGAILRG